MVEDTVTPNSCACSLHFQDTDYINPQAKRKVLRNQAIPSKKLPGSCETPVKAKERRSRCSNRTVQKQLSNHFYSSETVGNERNIDHNDVNFKGFESERMSCNQNESFENRNSNVNVEGFEYEENFNNCGQNSDAYKELKLKYDRLKEDYDKLKIRFNEKNTEYTSLSKIFEELKVTSEKNIKTYESKKLILEAEIDVLKQENLKTNSQFLFNWEHIKEKDRAVRHFTGLPSAEIFELLYSLFENVKLHYFLGWNVSPEKISRKNQLLITLMKLKLNVTNFELTTWFPCSYETIRNIFLTWLYALHHFLFRECMKEIPSRQKNSLSLPPCFGPFPNCRIVIDCTEIQVEIPKDLEQQKKTFSNYKHRNTFKALIGISPVGVVTFASKLFGGRTSDKEIVQQSGLLQNLDQGDMILADKGFVIDDILPYGVSCNIPPFLITPQFSANEVAITRNIAKARIHIERAIERVKRYQILNLITANERHHADIIFQTCAALTNLDGPLIKDMEEFLQPTVSTPCPDPASDPASSSNTVATTTE